MDGIRALVQTDINPSIPASAFTTDTIPIIFDSFMVLLGSGQNPHFSSRSYRLVVAHHSRFSFRPSRVHSWCHWWLYWKGNTQGIPWAFPLIVYTSRREKQISQIQCWFLLWNVSSVSVFLLVENPHWQASVKALWALGPHQLVCADTPGLQKWQQMVCFCVYLAMCLLRLHLAVAVACKFVNEWKEKVRWSFSLLKHLQPPYRGCCCRPQSSKQNSGHLYQISCASVIMAETVDCGHSLIEERGGEGHRTLTWVSSDGHLHTNMSLLQVAWEIPEVLGCIGWGRLNKEGFIYSSWGLLIMLGTDILVWMLQAYPPSIP